jgi:hypothetical protein
LPSPPQEVERDQDLADLAPEGGLARLTPSKAPLSRLARRKKQRATSEFGQLDLRVMPVRLYCAVWLASEPPRQSPHSASC